MGMVKMSGPQSMSALWNLGLGSASESTMVGWTKEDTPGLAAVVLIANVPHVVFSLLYFSYNNLFTRMLGAKEWSEFGLVPKSLRVSSRPQGKQRSRYFLQLPYRFSIPLIVVCALIHWLMSQSIFVVAVESLHAPEETWELVTCGYSPIAIIFVLIGCLLLVFAILGVSFLRLPTTVPVVGNCSLAIAAACHSVTGEPQPNAPLGFLKWGVMMEATPLHAGHCGFSTEAVAHPRQRFVYV